MSAFDPLQTLAPYGTLMGILTPALAFLLVTDLTNFWLFIWGSRDVLTVSYRIVFAGVLLAMVASAFHPLQT